ncbi:MAG TPA: ELM1/GtrOC1 family putative glycosyltransferase [bacterium]
MSDIKPIKVTIISDGKPGHENQSLGIAERLPESNIMILRHSLRIGPEELFLRFKSIFPGNQSESKLVRELNQVFGNDKVQELLDFMPDVVISTGTFSAAPCLLAGKLTGAKTCACMTPSLVPVNKFDLAVIPVHDNPPDKPNVITTNSAPNRVTDEFMRNEWEKWKEQIPSDGNFISWVIGGPSSSVGFDSDKVINALEATFDWAEENQYWILLSTARRTPVALENKISGYINKVHALRWTLIWHMENKNPLYAMFHISDAAIVTSDSVSMISEASSAGCGPLIFQSEKTNAGTSKQNRMITNMLDKGYGRLVPDDKKLVLALKQYKSSGFEWRRLDETTGVAGKLLEIIKS